MKSEQNYVEINRQSWNNSVDAHLSSDFYNQKEFMRGKTSLNPIDLAMLGEVKGKRILHLQCHFGQDTISLSRLGAVVIGVDLSDKSIEAARKIAAELEVTTQFICCDIYDLPNHLNEQFDIVYTSYGVIAWLPDLNKWAALISKFLKPSGKLVFVEFHPVVWMFSDDFNAISYSYFNSGAQVESEEGTYADNEAKINQEYVTWNHGLGEVITSLIQNGLNIDLFEEYDYSPYACFSHSVEVEYKKYRIAPLDDKIPMLYAIVATKKD